MDFEILVFPTLHNRVTWNEGTTIEGRNLAKCKLPLKTKIKCRRKTSYLYRYRRSSQTVALSVRCWDWCRSMWHDRKTRRRRTSAAEPWKPSHNGAQRCDPVSEIATTLCTDRATTAGTRGCNCHSGSSASVRRRITTAASRMNVLCNYKLSFTNKQQEP